ncbi:hypothetical protein O3M35_012613 [Rhynocoris fuscipes]|uniref:Uncharacterized protein n=1 Tax=Rhynocoris fuscipes TaxID=488301 RepID=A0AAW1D0B3_9HEMI
MLLHRAYDVRTMCCYDRTSYLLLQVTSLFSRSVLCCLEGSPFNDQCNAKQFWFITSLQNKIRLQYSWDYWF